MLATLLAEGLVIGVRAQMSELGPGCFKTAVKAQSDLCPKLGEEQTFHLQIPFSRINCPL